jgi:hypothetical protein
MWTLNGTEIPAPNSKPITRNVQEVTHRTLNGSFSRDFVGDEKIIIEAEYEHISASDYNVLNTIYEDQRDNGTEVTLVINDTDFSFNAPVLIKIDEIDFDLPNHYNYRKCRITFTEV